MKVYNKPKQAAWRELIQRPVFNQAQLDAPVQAILNKVALGGDKAVLECTQQFDGVDLDTLSLSAEQINTASQQISAELKDAIQLAYDNIYRFHQAQQVQEPVIETTPGVKCWRKSVAIEKVGLYIPGGSAPLFSTILMLGIPAKIAGCQTIVLCTPPNKDKTVHPAILFAAQLVGISNIYLVGGAQAIAAMAYGTESIPKVDKIFGPGNQYVTKAKTLVQQSGTAIDMPAGPSEVLIIADDTCNADFVAADLLSQAEHGPDSQVILLSDREFVVEECLKALEKQLEKLPRKTIAAKALSNSKAIILEAIPACIAFSNAYAPEHLIIASEKANQYQDTVVNAGSVFLGNYSCESAGDYASGTNHTLPTNGFARNYSGVSLDSFVKKITFQELNPQGIQNIGRAIEIMAEAEQLIAHKNAVTLRLKAIDLMT